MPSTARPSRAPVTAHFEFEAFKPLPCGCVAAVHRMLDPELLVVSLEAKGTYCDVPDHVAGRVSAVPSGMAG